MNDPARRHATYQDVLDSPPHTIAQVLDGVLHVLPRPAGPHVAAASALGDELGPPFKRGRGGPGGWLIVDEPELHLAADIVVPDLAGWRRERLPQLPVGPYVELAPDWVCEVLFPRSVRIDRYEKRNLFAREGVRHLWFVDPRARTLEAFELVAGRYAEVGTFVDDAVVRVIPFDAIELQLGVLWADVEQTATD